MEIVTKWSSFARIGPALWARAADPLWPACNACRTCPQQLLTKTDGPYKGDLGKSASRKKPRRHIPTWNESRQRFSPPLVRQKKFDIPASKKERPAAFFSARPPTLTLGIGLSSHFFLYFPLSSAAHGTSHILKANPEAMVSITAILSCGGPRAQLAPFKHSAFTFMEIFREKSVDKELFSFPSRALLM